MTAPRCTRVTSYEEKDMRMHVYLDTHEVEMVSMSVDSAFRTFMVRMKSGKELFINEDDFERIKKAMLEREF